MGFNKKYLPPLAELKKHLADYPETLKYYLNADALIGSRESIDYLDQLALELNSKKAKNS